MAQNLVCVAVHTVAAGDTLYSIAKMHNVSVPLLMKVNCITNPYNLRIGSKLCIPGSPSSLDIDFEHDACNGLLYTVEKGDTLYMIAKRFRISLNSIIEANPDVDPYNMMIGTRLCIPR